MQGHIFEHACEDRLSSYGLVMNKSMLILRTGQFKVEWSDELKTMTGFISIHFKYSLLQ